MSRIVWCLLMISFFRNNAGSVAPKKCCKEGDLIFEDEYNSPFCFNNMHDVRLLLNNDEGESPGMLCEGNTTIITDLNSEATFDCLDLRATRNENIKLAGYKCVNGTTNAMAVIPKDHVELVTTCCAADEVFDYKTRECVRIKRTEYENKKLPSNRTFFYTEYKRIKCDYVTVDYEVDVDNVHLWHEDTLKLVTSPSNGEKTIYLSYTKDKFCFDKTTQPGKLVFRVCKPEDYCQQNSCISKCSYPGKYYTQYDNSLKAETLHSAIMKNNSMMFRDFKNVITNNTDYGLYINEECDQTLLEYNWKVLYNGSLESTSSSHYYNHKDYCLILKDPFGSAEILAFNCKDKVAMIDIETIVFTNVQGYFCLFSFIVTVFLIIHHIMSKNNRDTFNKFLLLIFHIMALIPLTHGITYFNFLQDTVYCQKWGYIILVLLFSIFVTMHVMCYDLWHRIRNAEECRKNRNKNFFDQFLFILLITLFFTTIASIFNKYQWFVTEDSSLLVETCWLPSPPNAGMIVYIIFPLIIFNVISIIHMKLAKQAIERYKLKLEKSGLLCEDYSTFNLQIQQVQIVLFILTTNFICILPSACLISMGNVDATSYIIIGSQIMHYELSGAFVFMFFCIGDLFVKVPQFANDLIIRRQIL